MYLKICDERAHISNETYSNGFIELIMFEVDTFSCFEPLVKDAESSDYVRGLEAVTTIDLRRCVSCIQRLAKKSRLRNVTQCRVASLWEKM